MDLFESKLSEQMAQTDDVKIEYAAQQLNCHTNMGIEGGEGRLEVLLFG
jgi:hypothetical protein